MNQLNFISKTMFLTVVILLSISIPANAATSNTKATNVQFKVPIKLQGFTKQNSPRRMSIKCYVSRRISGSQIRLLGEKGVTKTISPSNRNVTITISVNARSGQYFQKGDIFQCNQTNRIPEIDTFRSVLKVKGNL